MAELSQKEKDELKKRVQLVNEVYPVYEQLKELGHTLSDKDTPFQIACPFHEDNKPSARYYPGSDKENYGHVHCFSCKAHTDTCGLYAKLKNIGFGSALKELERRFNIKIKETKEEKPIPGAENPKRLISLAEKKLRQIRNSSSLQDYVKICQMVDGVEWEIKKSEKVSPKIIENIHKILEMVRQARLNFEQQQELNNEA
jgi:DNA primase